MLKNCLLNALVLFSCIFVYAEVEIMPLDQIKPGMVGYGLSVFQGEKVERFQIEVIDILRGFLPDDDIIIVRCRPVYNGYNLEFSGVVAGMSGSPIYIDGKLIGALSYGWDGAKEPIAGVTPIESMLKITKRPIIQQAENKMTNPQYEAYSQTNIANNFSAQVSQNSNSYLATTSNHFSSGSHNFSGDSTHTSTSFNRVGLVPLATPVVISNANPRMFDKFQKVLAQHGMMAVTGGVGLGAKTTKAPNNAPNLQALNAPNNAPNLQALNAPNNAITPEAIYDPGPDFTFGSAIAAQLVTGDLDLSAIGTVTWRDKNQILAFGHPFLNAGNLQMPIANAHISMILAANIISFKMGYPIRRIGTLHHDQGTGIYGRLGDVPPTVPFQLDLINHTDKTEHTYNFEIINHPTATLVLAALAMENFVSHEEPIFNEYTIRYTTKIFIPNQNEPITWTNTETGLAQVNLSLLDPLNQLYRNSFERVKILRVHITMEITEKMQYARLGNIRAMNSEAVVGENLDLEVTIIPQYSEPEILHITLPIPKNADLGMQPLFVTTVSKLPSNQFQPENMPSFLATLQENNSLRNNQIFVVLPLPCLKLQSQGQTLDNLPRSIISNLITTEQTKNIQIRQDTKMVVVDTPYQVTGGAQLLIRFVSPIKSRQNTDEEDE